MAGTSDKPRILVVDDSKSMREPLIASLNLNDCECTGAANREEAISIFKNAMVESKPFDAVITDMEMGPRGSGLDVANEIKGENGLSKSTPVFLLSTINVPDLPHWELFDKTFSKEDVIEKGPDSFINEILSVIKDTKSVMADTGEGRLRILVVDSEQFNTSYIDSLMKEFEARNCDLGIAFTYFGEGGIAEFKAARDERRPFDAVILDKDGLDVATAINGENGLSKSTPLFLIFMGSKPSGIPENLFAAEFNIERQPEKAIADAVVSVIRDTKAIIAENLKLARPTTPIVDGKKQALGKTISQK